VAAGDHAEVAVEWQPAAAGAASATLRVGDVAIDVAGTGVCPLSLSTTSCDFGDVDVGAAAFCDVDVVTGDCGGVVDVAVVDGGGVFSLETAVALPLALQPATTTTFRVKAAPTSDGVAIGTFLLNDTTITLRVDS
jgi:hypothetical protein